MLVRRNSGFAMVVTLWTIALMGGVLGSFALNSIYNAKTQKAISSVSEGKISELHNCLKGKNDLPNPKNMKKNAAKNFTAETLMNCHSPKLQFHPDEKYYPTTVKSYLQNSALYYNECSIFEFWCDDPNPLGKGEITPSNLAKQKAEKSSSGGALGGLFGGGDDGGTHESSGGGGQTDYYLDFGGDKSGNLKQAKVYSQIKPSQEGQSGYYIQYWIFYPFKGNLTFLPSFMAWDHQGDWETVTVHVTEDGQFIKETYYGARDGEGRWYPPKKIDPERVAKDSNRTFTNRNGFKWSDSGRPIVYVAKKSHAHYPDVGTQKRIEDDVAVLNFLSDANSMISKVENIVGKVGKYGQMVGGFSNQISQVGDAAQSAGESGPLPSGLTNTISDVAGKASNVAKDVEKYTNNPLGVDEKSKDSSDNPLGQIGELSDGKVGDVTNKVVETGNKIDKYGDKVVNISQKVNNVTGKIPGLNKMNDGNGVIPQDVVQDIQKVSNTAGDIGSFLGQIPIKGPPVPLPEPWGAVYTAVRTTLALVDPLRDALNPDDVTADGGKEWTPEGRIVNVGTKKQPIDGHQWLKYNGRWGDIGYWPVKEKTSGDYGPPLSDLGPEAGSFEDLDNNSGNGQNDDGNNTDDGETSDKIKLNNASQSQLEKLDGIGPVKAKRIMKYRKKFGDFSSLSDLKEIKGIGTETLQEVKNELTI